MTFPTDRWSYNKKMDDMQQLFDSEGRITFSNKHTNFETLTKLQNLTLYITNRTFLYNTDSVLSDLSEKEVTQELHKFKKEDILKY